MPTEGTPTTIPALYTISTCDRALSRALARRYMERRNPFSIRKSGEKRAPARAKSFNDSLYSGSQSYYDDSGTSPDIFPIANLHVPRSVSPLGFGGEHDTSTSLAISQPSGQTSPPVSETYLNASSDGGCRLSQNATHGSLVPIYPFILPSRDDSRSIVTDVLTKDPEALVDTKDSAVVDAARTDPSIMTTALITALGLLSSHSSNPRVAVFQLSAAAVSFTLIALYAFHSKEASARENTFVQRLLKYFPALIFASCWILFLLGMTLASPKAMGIVVCLVVLASIPMVGGARLPAALTLAIMTLFSLTFFALIFLVCVLPTEWLA